MRLAVWSQDKCDGKTARFGSTCGNEKTAKASICDPKLRTLNRHAKCGSPEDKYYFSPVRYRLTCIRARVNQSAGRARVGICVWHVCHPPAPNSTGAGGHGAVACARVGSSVGRVVRKAAVSPRPPHSCFRPAEPLGVVRPLVTLLPAAWQVARPGLSASQAGRPGAVRRQGSATRTRRTPGRGIAAPRCCRRRRRAQSGKAHHRKKSLGQCELITG
jgi:hypothetical protein